MAYFEVNKKPRLTFPTLTGSIVTFNSQYAGLPLKSHKIALTPTQSGSGTPSPDNVRTINGYSAIGVSATGLNLWGGEAFYKPLVANGATLDTVNKTVSYSGGVARDTGMVFDKFKPNTQYTLMLHVKSSNKNGNMVINYTDGTNQQVLFGTETGDYQYLFTTPNTKSVRDISFGWISGTAVIYYDEVCLLEGVKTIDDFVPYGTYTTINLGGTYYGGEYDARTGVLTVTHGYLFADGSFNVDRVNLSGSTYYCVVKGDIDGINGATAISDKFNSNVSLTIGSCYVSGGNNWLICILPDQTISTVAGATEWFTNNPTQFVYELDTPTTIQLPPCPIDTQIVNNIWTDTGDTTLQYPKFG